VKLAGILNQFGGGWQLSTITRIQSGAVTETSAEDSGGRCVLAEREPDQLLRRHQLVFDNPGAAGASTWPCSRQSSATAHATT
jgi:hypothetical protein